jgi:hypothetical protein
MLASLDSGIWGPIWQGTWLRPGLKWLFMIRTSSLMSYVFLIQVCLLYKAVETITSQPDGMFFCWQKWECHEEVLRRQNSHKTISTWSVRVEWCHNHHASVLFPCKSLHLRSTFLAVHSWFHCLDHEKKRNYPLMEHISIQPWARRPNWLCSICFLELLIQNSVR